MKHDYVITVIFEGRHYKPVIRKTDETVSAYANRMYNKFCEKYGIDRADRGLTVQAGYFDDNFDWHDYCTYHA